MIYQSGVMSNNLEQADTFYTPPEAWMNPVRIVGQFLRPPKKNEGKLKASDFFKSVRQALFHAGTRDAMYALLKGVLKHKGRLDRLVVDARTVSKQLTGEVYYAGPLINFLGDIRRAAGGNVSKAATLRGVAKPLAKLDPSLPKT